MLREARANCDERDLGNVTFLRSDDDLSAVSEGVDLVTTFIVLQHIPCIRGSRIVGRLVDVLNDGGVGVIHVTYSNQKMDAALENTHPAWPTPDGLRHHLSGLRRAVSRRLEGLVSDRQRPRKKKKATRPVAAPMATPMPVMQMNPYTLNPLFHMLQQAGVRDTYVEFTDHGGVFGVVLYFKKQPGAPYQL